MDNSQKKKSNELESYLKKLYKAILLVAIILLAAVLHTNQVIKNINYLITDRFYDDSPRDDIVVITINDQDLQKYGPWPWSRSLFAQLLQRLDNSEARVVALDILFLDKTETDEVLQQTLDNLTRSHVILPSKIEDGQEYRSIFKGKNVSQGFVNYYVDGSGRVRQATLSHYLDNGQCLYSFSTQILRSYNGRTLQNLATCANKGQIYLNFSRQTFKALSFNDALHGDFDFKDKIVLIGVGTTDIRSNVSDTYLSISGREEPRVFLHAYTINSILNNSYLTELPTPFYIFIVTVFVVVLLLLLTLVDKKFSHRILAKIVVFLFTNFLFFLVGFLFMESHFFFDFMTGFILQIIAFMFFTIASYWLVYRENLYVKELFGRYVNSRLLEQLLQNKEQLHLGGLRKDLCILFTDIRNFTGHSERLSSEELVVLLNQLLTVMTEVIFKYDGTVDKYIGDAIMAFWNAPLEDPYYLEKAVLCSIKMQEALKDFNKKHGIELRMGIGLNAGEAVVGNVGSSRRLEYTALGDTVNIASRLEGLTKYYGVSILMAGFTNCLDPQMMKDVFFRGVDTVIVKGKTQPITIFQPLLRNRSNQHLKSEYEQALKLCSQEKFFDAERLLKKLVQKYKDGPSKVMLKRINMYRTGKILKKDVLPWKWETK